jgi:Tol biopolymer transport system component
MRQMNVSRSSEDETRPEWSPDGAKLAFNRPNGNGHDIYIMDVGNWGVATQLTSGIDAKGPKWSPNGVTLGFTSDAGGSPRISTIGSDGTGSLSLTPDHNAWSPAWSPEGSHLVYTSDKDGSEDLFVMSADGSSRVRITGGPGADTDPDWKR